MIRLASIGYGDIAQRMRFLEVAELEGRAQLVAIAGRDEAAMQRCAEKFQIDDCYTDVDAMLARDDIDAVLVLTPPQVHAEMTVKAIEAGKHVLIEKPMVMGTDEAHAIKNAMDGRNLVCFPLPHVSGTRFDLIKSFIAKGAVGQITGVEMHWGHRGPTHADWFYRRDIAGGGVLVDLGIYPLGTVAYVFGRAKHVHAMLSRRFPQRTMDDGTVIEPDVEDDAIVNLLLEDGLAVSLHATWNGYLSHHHTRTPMTVIGREGLLYSGGDGRVYVHRDDNDYAVLPSTGEDATLDGRACRAYTPAPDQSRGAVEEFIHRIEAQDYSQHLLDRQVHVAEVIEKAYAGGIITV